MTRHVGCMDEAGCCVHSGPDTRLRALIRNDLATLAALEGRLAELHQDRQTVLEADPGLSARPPQRCPGRGRDGPGWLSGRVMGPLPPLEFAPGPAG